ncbi:L,D-transpeptidase family protein [Bdellovibrio svalbardensis]|uniref:L,D-transpeptidase family protein n=1 Tax=Bdellovibrio svalbardensis TaxID=2972972 RepID=A0ABT6DES2_9BACT|nr:L,D-transpeptidase family protein [Bdellovibrio svalbardensis]MDG0815340.1 L,D-transpeptidase family protein [Bdellovibrio svalbardensis]
MGRKEVVLAGGVFLSILIALCTSVSHAQFQVSQPIRENSDYSSVLNQFELEDMRQAVLDVWKHGFNPQFYWTDKLEGIYQRGGSLEITLRPAANQMFLRLLKDVYRGSVDPQSAGRDVKFIRREFLTPQQLMTVAYASGRKSAAFIDLVAPRNPPYFAVKQAMEKIYPVCQSGAWTEITPVNTTLRLYARNKVIVDIKKRLALLGYKMTNADDLFDGDLLNAVSDIQWNMRIKPDGLISPNGKVWKYLSVSCMDRVRQLQVDMEKMRWFPQYFEDRYIFVNLAFSYFVLYDGSTDWIRTMTFRTVNGRPARKSPTMQDEVLRVIINPFWVVPPTIFSEDKVNDLKNLSKDQIYQYFTSHNYEVWDSDFKRKIDPTTVDWLGISEGRVTPDIQIRQLPHLGNALGVLKFDLTNSYAIYLHDTNQRELFNEPMRQLSSGCIRLEKPLDLAEYLLEDTPWDRKTIEAVMARPGEVLSKSTELPIPKSKHTSVYTVYLTSLISSDGVVRFVEDIYGQNAAIRRNIMAAF